MIEIIADVVPVPKESSSYNVGDYRSISSTPRLSKAFEKNVARKLSHLLVSSSLLPSSQLSYRRGVETCGAWTSQLHFI